MNGYVNKIMQKGIEALVQATAQIKEKITDFTDHSKEKVAPSFTVPELADYIQNHPKTKRSEMSLLGLSFSFYKLNTDDIYFYLETKNSYILQLDVQIKNHHLVAYRSYRDKLNLNTPFSLLNQKDEEAVTSNMKSH